MRGASFGDSQALGRGWTWATVGGGGQGWAVNGGRLLFIRMVPILGLFGAYRASFGGSLCFDKRASVDKLGRGCLEMLKVKHI